MSYKGYFIYKGVAYGTGTKVLFAENVCNKPRYNKKYIKEPHTFQWGNTGGYLGFVWFGKDEFYRNQRSDVGIYNPDEEIAEIVEPVYVEIMSWQKKAFDDMVNGNIYTDIFGGVILYIIAIIIGALFYARITIWIFATVIFIVWLLNQYRT